MRVVDYSESSQVVTLFCRDAGKVSAIAKGSKRAKSSFEGPIEVFSFGQIVYSPSLRGNLATLTEFQQRPVLRQLRKKLYCLNCGFFAAELVDALTEENDPHEALFDSLLQFLCDAGEAQSQRVALGLLVVFQLNLLSAIGAMCVLDGCANCRKIFDGKWRGAYFSSTANGLICYDCEQAFVDKLSISKGGAAAISNLQLMSKAGLSTMNEIEKILIYHLTAMLHRPPKMAKHFLSAGS